LLFRLTIRNIDLVENNIAFFTEIFRKDPPGLINTVIEFGAGTGQNIEALNCLLPNCKFTSVEINKEAADQIPHGQVYRGSMFDFKQVDPPADLVLTKGLLIHIPPEKLQEAYEILYKSSAKYILICEYYNPTPTTVLYRGNRDKLWKRDFAGEMLDKFPDLELIDYGFRYYRDEYSQDDLTWFLLSKNV